jgi:hypothetical protein
MTTADRETIVGRLTYKENYYYLQLARAEIYRRTVLP